MPDQLPDQSVQGRSTFVGSGKLFLVLLTSFLVCSAIWFFAMHQIKLKAQEDIAAEFVKNANLTKFQEGRVSSALRVLDQVLLVLRDDYAKDGKRIDIKKRLATMHVDDRYVGLVTLIGADGAAVATTATDMAANFSDRDYFKEHATNADDHLLIGKPILGRKTGKWLISLTRRIYGPNGSFNGVIFLHLNPAFFAEDYANTDMAPHTIMSLVGMDGITRVRHMNGKDTYGDDLRGGQLFQQIRKSPTGSFIGESPTDQEVRAVTYRVVQDFPLVVVVASSLKEVSASSDSQRRVYLAAATVCSLLVLGLTALLLLSFKNSRREIALVSEGASRLRSIVNVSPVPMALNDAAGNITFLNQAFTETYGYRMEDIPTLALWWSKAYPDPTYRQWVIQAWGEELERVKQTGKRFSPLEINIRCADGRTKIVAATATEFAHSANDEHLVVLYDFTLRKESEQALTTMLKEKVALLMEVHHRVKNNLQVISSLLRLESGRSSQPETKSVLGDMQGRLRSMAVLHESLYRAGTFASLDLHLYVERLVTEAFRFQTKDLAAIRLQCNLKPVQVGMDQAIPCGLLVNELISNALKHAFPPGHRGEICVELQPTDEAGEWRLTVSDTGVGLPEDFESRKRNSLGLQLIGDLIQQLNGRMEIETDRKQGVAFNVMFNPEPNTSPKS